MITIRTPKEISQPTLIGFEATLKTRHAVFELSSNGPAIDAGGQVGGGLYGRIVWPRTLFRLGSDLVLEQQMFVLSRLLGCGNFLAASRQLDSGRTIH